MRRTSKKRSSETQTQSSSQSKIPSRDQPSSEDEESDEEPCTQYLREKQNAMKDCLAFLLVANSKLYPIKKSEIFSYFGEKVGRKERTAIIDALKKNLLEIGACLVVVDNNNFIMVNKFPRTFISDGPATPDKQLLCFLLSCIIVNRGTLKKTELENRLSTLGISLQTNHPYYGDVSKLIVSFEKQCYLKKCFDKNKNSSFEWGVRAKCEVDREEITRCINSVMRTPGTRQSILNIPDIISPEDELISEESDA